MSVIKHSLRLSHSASYPPVEAGGAHISGLSKLTIVLSVSFSEIASYPLLCAFDSGSMIIH